MSPREAILSVARSSRFSRSPSRISEKAARWLTYELGNSKYNVVYGKSEAISLRAFSKSLFAGTFDLNVVPRNLSLPVLLLPLSPLLFFSVIP